MGRTRKIKVEGSALEDAAVSHISLVARPANRTPFRIMKHDKGSEESSMFNLNVFARKQEPEAPAVKAVIVSEEFADRMATKLEADGFKTDDRSEQDGVVLFKQGEYDESKVAGVQLSDEVGILVSTNKAFDSFPDSISFDENVRKAGFMPGVAHGLMALEDTVRSILFKSENRQEAVSTMKNAIDEFSAFVVGMAENLPEQAFVVEKAAKSLSEEAASEGASDDSVEKDESTSDDTGDDTTDESVEKDEVDTGGEADAEADATKADESADGSADDGSEGGDEAVAKTDEEDPVLKAVTALTEKVDTIAKGQKALKDRLDATDESLKEAKDNLTKTQKALRTSVSMGASDDTHPDETTDAERTSASKSGGSVWDGCPGLDKLVG